MGAHKDRYASGFNPARVSGAIYAGGKYGYLKEIRQQEAQERAEVRASRSPEEQLAVLDKRLGKGKGAQRERARLQALIEGAE
jgi:hypothetical protein